MRHWLVRCICCLATCACPALLAAPGIFVPAVTTATPGRVEFNAAALYALKPGTDVALGLPDGSLRPFLVEALHDHGGGIATFVARDRDLGNLHRVVITRGPGATFGNVSTPSGDWTIVPHADGLELLPVTLTKATRQPLQDALEVPADVPRPKSLGLPALQRPSAPGEEAVRSKATPAPVYDVDLMVVYSSGLARRLGMGLMTRLYNMVENVNVIYADSEVALHLRLVTALQVDYPDNVAPVNVLNAISPDSGLFDAATFGGVEAERTRAGADLVAFWGNGGAQAGGGYAWIDTHSLPRWSYSAINGAVFSGDWIFAHELGHNMGLRHDRATEAWQAGGTPNYPQAFVGAAYGYVHCSSGAYSCNPQVPASSGGCSSEPECSTASGGNFSDLMSYFYGSVRLNPKFSNDNITCSGTDGVAQICGTGALVSNAANAAYALNLARDQVSGSVATVVQGDSAGALALTAGDAGIAESAGVANFVVRRVGPGHGAAKVSYRTVDGTALAGLDYTATSGTLQWGDGDTSDRAISIPITVDGVAEPAENLRVELYDPTGDFVPFIGYPGHAVLTLVDEWPASGLQPSGFTTPSYADGGWTVASDTAFEGSSSLRSAQVYAVPGHDGAAVAQFDGMFVDGFLSFAYRVSSGSGPGTGLSLLVDGMQQMLVGGETGWVMVAFPIKAGAHQLVWRFNNPSTVPCRQQAGSTANCDDRAWIDAVAMPLAMPAAAIAVASSANPAPAGTDVTLTATLQGGSGVPAGYLIFRDAGNAVPGCQRAALASGQATCTLHGLAAGSHAITVVYSGDLRYRGGTTAAFTQGGTGTAHVRLSAETLDFGAQSMKTTSPFRTLQLLNDGSSPVAVTGTTLSGGGAAQFRLQHDCGTLAPGAQCTLRLAFAPAVTSGAPLNGTVTVDATLGVATDAAGSLSASLTGVAEKSLVAHYYQAILGRAPDAGGKAYWAQQASHLSQQGIDVNEAWFAMAAAFFSSGEYAGRGRDDAGFATDLYAAFFDRLPDAQGFDYWMSSFANGMPREVALAQFMLSPEFVAFSQSIFGPSPSRAEVGMTVDFYRGLLGRLPDDDGFTYWVGQFRTAQCAGADAVRARADEISRDFLGSAEYANRARGDGQYVGDLYNSFLRRGGDLDGVRYWIDALQAQRMTREDVRRAFAASSEFSSRVEAVARQGCSG